MQQHYRSGSTKQELKGAALDKFMLQKKGKRWDDGVPVPHVSVSDLRQETAVLYAKEHDFITNAEYREINETKQTLSSEELGEIVEKGIL
ncbi:hypothetical protein [uncultured Proteiniphilum sp.]|uniref:hypothetical protein n=1 Tax=uncultured Proteiniphilum sp. TaxID=497637 RepID=UPI00262C5F0A|nr:hypothetical protein [uncultured Proteiniphilum sp.]